MGSKDKVFYSKNTLCVNGNLIDLTIPKIMGILNVTEDSFFDGGKFLSDKNISGQVEKLITEGADFIDLGAYSSRPGAKDIDEGTETERILAALKIIRKLSADTAVSVDTFRSVVAKKAVDSGANIINDISGGNLDPEMPKTAAELNVPYILMHMVGNPQNMHKHTTYKQLIPEMINYFHKKVSRLTQLGIKDVIIDVGFGFSKTTDQNYNLLTNLKIFQVLNAPMLVGISRKSMIYKMLKTDPENALNGTGVLNTTAILKGAKILRVHDVKAAREVIELTKLITN